CRDREESGQGQNTGEGSGEQESDGGEGAEEERGCRRATTVDVRDPGRSPAVTTHGVQDAGGAQDGRVGYANESDRHERTNDSGTALAENHPADGRDGQIFAGESVDIESVEQRGVCEDVDGAEQQVSVDHGTREIDAGVDDFIAKVERAVPAVVSIDDRLKDQNPRDEEPHARGDGNRGPGGCGRAMGERERGHDQREKEERGDGAGKVLKTAPPTDAAPLHERDEDDDRGRDGGGVGSYGKHEVADVFAGEKSDDGARAAQGNPVGPANDHAEVVAEGTAGNRVVGPGARNQGA